ncbi:MAG: intradiol ring-cleavage dioxygenase [Pseudomonadota bacterium]
MTDQDRAARLRAAPLPTRRRFVRAAPALLLGLAAPSLARALTATPQHAEGPFYPKTLPADRDWDLTLFDGQAAPGEVMEMVGRVFAVSGAPIAGAAVEIWHCDPNGVYAHIGRKAAANFQGYGALRTARDGAYRFRTTRPGVYPGRPRHIHVKARAEGFWPLTTQMYFPETEGDWDGAFWARTSLGSLIAKREAGEPPRYRFDMVLGG